MNATVNKLLLAGDKFMPKMHLRQPRFTYSACGPFTINKEMGDSRYSGDSRFKNFIIWKKKSETPNNK